MGAGDSLYIRNGVTLSFAKGADFLVDNAKVYIEENVSFEAVDTGSFMFLSNVNLSLSSVDFRGFSAPKERKRSLPSSITFYKCRGEINACGFYENRRGDDLVNIFNCYSLIVDSCIFENAVSDALDVDFSQLSISNSSFVSAGNDGLDCSGSKVILVNSSMCFIDDKAVSAGEETDMWLENITIAHSAIGLVSKDGSIVNANNVSLDSCIVAISAFQKKSEYSNPELYFQGDYTGELLIEPYVLTNLTVKRTEEVKGLMYGKSYGKQTVK